VTQSVRGLERTLTTEHLIHQAHSHCRRDGREPRQRLRHDNAPRKKRGRATVIASAGFFLAAPSEEQQAETAETPPAGRRQAMGTMILLPGHKAGR
jgi:hypothetical protein